MVFLRIVLALVLSAAAVFFVILGTTSIDSKSVRNSIDNHKAMLTDLQKIGNYTESYRKKNGSPPDDVTLDKWLQKKKFEKLIYTDGMGMLLSIESKSGKCGDIEVATLSGGQPFTYFLCYTHSSFRFMNDDAFIPQTGASSLGTSSKDFEMPLSVRITYGFMAALLFVLALILVFGTRLGLGRILGPKSCQKLDK
jgi:hypothetical protein